MHCQHCGNKYEPSAVYCSKCGKPLLQDAQANEQTQAIVIQEHELFIREASASLVPEQAPVRNRRNRAGAGRKFIIALVPVVVFITTSAGVFSYYIYESDLNDHVAEWHEQAKQKAWGGKYHEAMIQLEKAAKVRPAYGALQEDMDIVNEAVAIENKINSLASELDNGALTEAGPLVKQLNTLLAGREEQIFSPLREAFADLNVRMVVVQVQNELDQINSLDALAVKLNTVNGLGGEEAVAVRKQIVDKIAIVCQQQTKELLQKKSFSEAIATVQKGMAYAPEDTNLTKLLESIHAEKQAFEKAEQERIERAMQKAAEEDLLNQTAAAQVVKVDTSFDETGSFKIHALLKNAATRPIYSVEIQYSVRGKDKQILKKGTSIAMPNYIEPNESFTFDAAVEGIEETDATVVIDHVTWYLD